MHRVLFKVNISIIGFKLTCKHVISFPGSFSLIIWKSLMKTDGLRKLALELLEAILETLLGNSGKMSHQ